MKTILRLVLLAAAAFPPPAPTQPLLTLAEAERLALEHAPWFQHHRSNVEAAAERSVYEGRLPDPQLTLGVLNVPTDSFKLDQEDMTMLMVGLRQSFPPGDTLALRTRRAGQELTREQARLELERRNLLREVRGVWFDLFVVNAALGNLARTRSLLERQLVAAEGRYRAAQETLPAVLRARQALARLDEKVAEQRAQQKRAQTQLARWIRDEAFAPLPTTLPALAPIGDSFDVTRHPDWIAAQAGLDAARADTGISRQEYKPGMMLDLQYGRRQSAPGGMERSDLATVMLTFDLPLFRDKRQDRRLAEKQALERGAQWEVEDKRRELETRHQSLRADYDALGERIDIVEQRLLPELRRAAQLTVAGFAREQAELREARMQELETELELTRLRAERARVQAEILYFTGEAQP